MWLYPCRNATEQCCRDHRPEVTATSCGDFLLVGNQQSSTVDTADHGNFLLQLSPGRNATIRSSRDRRPWQLTHVTFYLQEAGPLEEMGMVMAVLDKSFDVYVLNLGVVKRVYCDVSREIRLLGGGGVRGGGFAVRYGSKEVEIILSPPHCLCWFCALRHKSEFSWKLCSVHYSSMWDEVSWY